MKVLESRSSALLSWHSRQWPHGHDVIYHLHTIHKGASPVQISLQGSRNTDVKASLMLLLVSLKVTVTLNPTSSKLAFRPASQSHLPLVSLSQWMVPPTVWLHKLTFLLLILYSIYHWSLPIFPPNYFWHPSTSLHLHITTLVQLSVLSGLVASALLSRSSPRSPWLPVNPVFTELKRGGFLNHKFDSVAPIFQWLYFALGLKTSLWPKGLAWSGLQLSLRPHPAPYSQALPSTSPTPGHSGILSAPRTSVPWPTTESLPSPFPILHLARAGRLPSPLREDSPNKNKPSYYSVW